MGADETGQLGVQLSVLSSGSVIPRAASIRKEYSRQAQPDLDSDQSIPAGQAVPDVLFANEAACSAFTATCNVLLSLTSVVFGRNRFDRTPCRPILL